ncbi:MAG: acetyl-CoA C-acetyltransferase [bacterium JZ-2024 1]
MVGMNQKDIYIVNGARTPFGKFLGSFREVSSEELGAVAAREAMRRAGIEPDQVDHTVIGNVIQSHAQSIYEARHIALKAGVPVDRPALTVNRLCGSGAEAILQGAYLIWSGAAEIVLAGGTENMSQIPHICRNARVGAKYGDFTLKDYLWESLMDEYCGLSMAMTAEKLAEIYHISRQEADEYAYLTQMRYKAAKERGRWKKEIVPVEVKEGKKTRVVEEDEHPKPDTTIEALSQLTPYFKKDGVVTAGNASGIVDGACVVVLASREKVELLGLKPMSRLVAWGHGAVSPDVMGLGPVPASRNALKRAGLTLDQIDIVEINEAFVPQYLAVEKELGLARERTNVNGGATAIGHPLGATGARLAYTASLELIERKARYALISMCIGGGQGITLILENAQL